MLKYVVNILKYDKYINNNLLFVTKNLKMMRTLRISCCANCSGRFYFIITIINLTYLYVGYSVFCSELAYKN